jgi:hypothetical protein
LRFDQESSKYADVVTICDQFPNEVVRPLS